MLRHFIVSFVVLLFVSCESNLKYHNFHSLVDLCDKTLDKKPALVFLGIDGCDMCDLFEMKVLSNPEVIDYINKRFTLYKLNVKKHPIFNKLGHLYSFPMFAIVDQSQIKSFLTPARNVQMFLLDLKNFDKRPLDYNIATFTKLDGDPSNIAESIRLTFNAVYHKEKGDLSDKRIMEILEKSVETSPYFYNRFLLAELYEKVDRGADAAQIYRDLSIELSPFDEHVYADDLPILLSRHYQVDISKYAKINFDEKVYDFGEIKKDQPVSHNFLFRNESDQPLLIFSIISSCGCTVADYPKYPILPNQVDTIAVTFNSKNIGTFNKSIFVLSNASEKRVVLNVKGRVSE